jgi:preprotein translocase subunit SecG
MMYYFVVTFYVVVCLTLILVVLLQQGKGGGMASAFGGGGGTQAAFGARSGATVLSRATAVCAIIFVVGALVLGIIGQRGPGSVTGGFVPTTQETTPAPPLQDAPTPAQPAP